MGCFAFFGIFRACFAECSKCENRPNIITLVHHISTNAKKLGDFTCSIPVVKAVLIEKGRKAERTGVKLGVAEDERGYPCGSSVFFQTSG